MLINLFQTIRSSGVPCTLRELLDLLGALENQLVYANIDDFDIYAEQLKHRLDPSVAVIQGINSQIKKNQKRVVFADGEDENNLKAAIAFKNNGLGEPILIAKEDIVKKKLYEIGYEEKLDIKIINSTDKELRERYVKFLFKKLQRKEG